MLTVVTASHRNLQGLRRLEERLIPSLGERLRWIIKDSGACVETRAWAAKRSSPWLCFDAASDSGIYDALNQAIAQIATPYYLVVGSDDEVDGATLAQVADDLRRIRAEQQYDVITFPVRTSAGLRRRKRFRPPWVSSSGLTASHSVGTLIRTELHTSLGPYDVRYRILADSLFLRRARLAGARFEHRSGPVLGTFSLDGVSSVDHGRRLVETYSYLASTGSPLWLQTCLLGLRLLRYRPSSLL